MDEQLQWLSFDRLRWLSFQALVAPAVAVVRSIPVAVVRSLSCGYRSIDSIVQSANSGTVCRSQLLWLSFNRLRWLSIAVPVSVVPVAGVCLLNASVDIDDYQKRSPVEIVLESTGSSHVIVSNRVRGKHSIQSKIGCGCR